MAMTDRDADFARTPTPEGEAAPIATARCEMGDLFLFPDRLSFHGSVLQARLGREQPDREIALRSVAAVEWETPSFFRMGRLGLILDAKPGQEGGHGAATFAFQKWERQAFEAFRAELERCVDAARARAAETGSGTGEGEAPAFAPGPSLAPVADVPDQIRRLAQLRDDGLITAEQFEAKKRELLARM